MSLAGSSGRLYSLPSKEIVTGGEGKIYRLSDGLIIKIYLPKVIKEHPELRDKIAYMVKNPPSKSIMAYLAWPLDALYDQGSFCGFTMNELKGYEQLRELYSFSLSSKILTEQKLVAARNLAKIIKSIHSAGYVVGDLNPKNIGYSKEGNVCLYDIDSFQVTTPWGRVFKCGVFFDGYIAPEIIEEMEQIQRDLLRKGRAAQAVHPSDMKKGFTVETDNFALAVHIFQLLMNGFDPYSSISDKVDRQAKTMTFAFKSSSTTLPTANENLKNDYYCFASGRQPFSYAVPDKECFPDYVLNAFQKSFRHLNPGEKRTSADEWIKILANYFGEYRRCDRDKTHIYWKKSKFCPYCRANERYAAMAHTNGPAAFKSNQSGIPSYLNQYKVYYDELRRYPSVVDRHQLNRIIYCNRMIRAILQTKNLNQADRNVYNQACNTLKDLDDFTKPLKMIVHLPENTLEKLGDSETNPIKVSWVNTTHSNVEYKKFGEQYTITLNLVDNNGYLTDSPQSLTKCGLRFDFMKLKGGPTTGYKYSCFVPFVFGPFASANTYNLNALKSYSHTIEYDLIYTNRSDYPACRWKPVVHNQKNVAINASAVRQSVPFRETVTPSTLDSVGVMCAIMIPLVLLIVAMFSDGIDWYSQTVTERVPTSSYPYHYYWEYTYVTREVHTHFWPGPILVGLGFMALLFTAYLDTNYRKDLAFYVALLGTIIWGIVTLIWPRFWIMFVGPMVCTLLIGFYNYVYDCVHYK